MILSSTVLSVNFGAIFQPHRFRGGFRKVKFERSNEDVKRHDNLYEIIAMIPPDASVAAMETEAPHISSRDQIDTLRFSHHHADCLLINTKEVRPHLNRHKAVKALRTKRNGFVDAHGDFTLWKRDAPRDRNGEGNEILALKSPP